MQSQSDEARVLAAVEQRRMVAAALLRLYQHGCQAEPTLCSAAATLTGHGSEGLGVLAAASPPPYGRSCMTFQVPVDYNRTNPLLHHGGPGPFAYAELDFHRLVDNSAGRRWVQAAL